MARFSTDADLLVYEPRLFVEAVVGAQELVTVEDGALDGVVLSSATGGLGVLAVGGVVTLRDGAGVSVSVGVSGVVSDGEVELDRVVGSMSGMTGLGVLVRTFGPQADGVHGELMGSLGLDEASGLDESAVVSVELVRRLEVLGTLGRVYAAAVSADGGGSGFAAKADRYALAYGEAMASASVLLDTDGDGRADVWRRPGVGLMRRV